MMTRRLLGSCLIILAGMLWSLPVFAQADTATLSGRIADPQGKSVPKALVQITNIDTNVASSTETNAEGIYVFSGIKPGRYRLLVLKDGFHEIIKPEFTLHVQDDIQQNFGLQVGSVSETVTVSANAEQFATDSPAVGMTVTRDFVENMPLNGRSFQDLIALAPGTVSASDGTGLFSVNGQRDDANSFTVDGVSANLGSGGAYSAGILVQAAAGVLPAQTALGTTQSLVSVDDLQEFRIQTSGYSAEFGRQPGGQVELATRSGTNAYHGTAFDYFRNEALDANSWFLNSIGSPREPERQNDFGGTIGGPLKVPRLYDGKDKTFFFFSYEGLRLRLPEVAQENAPTLAFRQAAASTVQPFLNAAPIPNGAANNDACLPAVVSCTALFRAGFSNPSQLDAVSFRLDQNLGQKAQFFARYAYTPSKTSSRGNPASELDSISSNTETITLGTTVRLGAKVVDELRFNYSIVNSHLAQTPDTFGGAIPYSINLVTPPQFVNGATRNSVSFDLPNLSPNMGIPTYSSSESSQRQYALLNSVSWSHGSHELKFGVDYRRLGPVFSPYPFDSAFIFDSVTGVVGGVADLVFAAAFQGARPTFNNLSLYAQDSWRLTQRFTLSYGLRWEFNPAPGASNGLFPLAVSQTSNLATMELAPLGTPQYHTTYDNFAPRLGFAYELRSGDNHPLVVRAGGGVFYDTAQALGAEGYAGYPFLSEGITTKVPLPAAAAAITPPPFNFPPTPPYGPITVSDPNLKLPYTAQWNVSLDQGLSARNTLTISYAGNKGQRLLFTNQYSPTSNTNFTYADITDNQASSNYNAMQIQDHGYLAPGLQFLGSYTWAHALDNASNDLGTSGFPPLYGNSDNDLRQVLNFAVVYEIPSSDRSALLGHLTRGWLVANRFSAQTGYPFTVEQGTYTDPVSGAIVPILPDLVPGVAVYKHNVPGVPAGWQVNEAAFSPVPINPATGIPLMQGNEPRNFLHGPAFWNLNTSVQRNFAMTDRVGLQFRVDAFNIFNHPNLGSQIDNFLGDATFGQIIPFGVQTIGVPNQLYATGAARSLQLSLKLHF